MKKVYVYLHYYWGDYLIELNTEFYFTLKLKGVTDEEIITLIKAMKGSTTRPTSYEEVLELACKGSVVIK